MAERQGIVLFGSSIVDEILPVIRPGELSYVDAHRFVDESELKGEHIQYSVGGMALNVGVDLAKIKGGYPVSVVGKVGKDHRADLIRSTLKQHGIDPSDLIVDENMETSSTQVIYVEMPDKSIERIFRHSLGSMGSFHPDEIDFSCFSGYKLAMFGYGLLLPQFDLADAEYGTVMGRVLAQAREAGLRTVLDFVSPNRENMFKFMRYRTSLSFVDICCINEDQAMALTGAENAAKACERLVTDLGARLGVVHCGAHGPNYAFTTGQGLILQPNYKVPDSQIKGNAGAGDAFSAGLLHGMHQEWDSARSLDFAAAAAAISLEDASCTGAMAAENKILDYMKRVPKR